MSRSMINDPVEMFAAVIGWFIIITAALGLGHLVNHVLGTYLVGIGIFALLSVLATMLYGAFCFPKAMPRFRCKLK